MNTQNILEVYDYNGYKVSIVEDDNGYFASIETKNGKLFDTTEYRNDIESVKAIVENLI